MALKNRTERDNETSTPAEDTARRLRALSPTFQEGEHGQHADLLFAALTNQEAGAPRNVAVTGHYGSGKSSVIAEVERRLRKQKIATVNLSLPSLGVGPGRLAEGAEARDRTNLIQKEIVKQLLYRKQPSAMPASRYQRLDVFRWRAALGWAATVAVLVGLIGLLAGLPDRLMAVLPGQFASEHASVPWIGLLLIAVGSGGLAIAVMDVAHDRLRVEKLSAGPATVALSDQTSSYFDEYLDEIVYFFQKSKTAVAIFEDLDRFRDPHIFETLRELNTLLNSAEQLKTRPVRFVYAVRDSIFEELRVETAGDEDRPSVVERKAPETLRLTSTNRTKFFDLVIPMVPFISHRTSRDLIRRELEGLPKSHRPSVEVVDLVGAHLTDMRLIKNICNEFEIFAERLLPPRGLAALDADRLFAMMVYKNLYLRDFECVREGTSRLDGVYRQYRRLVTEEAGRARRNERESHSQLERLDDISPRSARYGNRLRVVLEATPLPPGQTFNASLARVQISGTEYDLENLTDPTLWRELAKANSLTFWPRGVRQQPSVSYNVQQLALLMGESLSVADWKDEDREDLQEAEREARDLHRSVTRASIAEILELTDLRVTGEGGEPFTLLEAAKRELGDSNLALDLLQRGFIDENFTLYVADFHGISVPAAAMNFILHSVQPNETDMQYHFGSPREIDAVVQEEGERLFAGRAVYNIEIFDHVLESGDDRLASAIERLAARAEAQHDTEFIDAYLATGLHPTDFITLLSGHWPSVFRYLAQHEVGTSNASKHELLSAAVAGARLEVNYQGGAREREVFEGTYGEVSVFTDQQNAEDAARIAELMKRLDVQIADLSLVPQPLRGELVERQLFPVTHTNLVAALGDRSSVSLDAILEHGSEALYLHVLAHLDNYLQVVSEQEMVTVLEPGAFVEVLVDVAGVAPDALEEVARKADARCVVASLDEIDRKAWPALAAARRFPLSMANVTAYIGEHGVSQPLADHLAMHRAISDLDDQQEARMSLAVAMANAVVLEKPAKVSLLESLELDAPLDPHRIDDLAVEIIPVLVEANLMADDAGAYRRLPASAWPLKEELIRVSGSFSEYLPELDLSANDLAGLAMSSEVSKHDKGWLLGQIEDLADVLDERAATALASSAPATGIVPSAEAVAVLARAGAKTEAVLRLIGDQVADWSLEQITPVLAALGEPWDELLKPGRHRPKLQPHPGVKPLLDRLQQVGPVSSYRDGGMLSSEIKVNMRHE